jgi:hypothetical protein
MSGRPEPFRERQRGNNDEEHQSDKRAEPVPTAGKRRPFTTHADRRTD